MAAAGASVLSVLVTTPLDVVKVRTSCLVVGKGLSCMNSVLRLGWYVPMEYLQL